jgi:hypothetical protein
MVRRLWQANKKLWIRSTIGVAIVILAVVVWIAQRDTLPKLATMSIVAPLAEFLPFAQGEEWKVPAVGDDGYAKVSENERFTLKLDPKTSQITILNKQNGYLWRSNPVKDKLSQETVQGTLLENLQSPYILEYTSGTETNRSVTNALDPKLTIKYTLMGNNGIQAAYKYTELQISFVIQYALTDNGLEVTVPDQGISEMGGIRIFALNVLPFFGAVTKSDEQGYLFVPDGPGGLVYYDRKRPPIGTVYDFPIYGDDPTNLKYQNIRTPQREQISFPVFGLKRGNQAFAAIVKDGQYTASIKAVLPGYISNYNAISVNFNYRSEYGRKVSGITNDVVGTIQKERNREDRRIEYRLLFGDEADYAGMAHSYRKYLEDSKMLAPQLKAMDHVPLQLSLIGGATKPKFGSNRYETATTFNQAELMVNELQQRGVANIRVTYQGWQSSGYEQTDQHFPVVQAIGGNQGAKKFVQAMHEKGVKVLFEDYMAWKNPKYSSFYVKSDGIRAIDTTVLQDRVGRFIVNPVKAIRGQKDVIDQLKKLGVDGIHYFDGPGNQVFSDYNPDSPLSRKDTAYYYQKLLDYTRDQMGTVGAVRGNDYSLSHVNFIEELPFDSSYDFMIDETVPFYPLVVHGTIEYTSSAANLRDIYDDKMLKAIEYGAIPFFRLTYSQSRVLKDTDYDFVYSGEYAVWKDRVVEEYKKFNQLAAVYNQRMTDHEKLAQGVYRTTYADGTSVTVNYNTKQFDVTKGGAR